MIYDFDSIQIIECMRIYRDRNRPISEPFLGPIKTDPMLAQYHRSPKRRYDLGTPRLDQLAIRISHSCSKGCFPQASS